MRKLKVREIISFTQGRQSQDSIAGSVVELTSLPPDEPSFRAWRRAKWWLCSETSPLRSFSDPLTSTHWVKCPCAFALLWAGFHLCAHHTELLILGLLLFLSPWTVLVGLGIILLISESKIGSLIDEWPQVNFPVPPALVSIKWI